MVLVEKCEMVDEGVYQKALQSYHKICGELSVTQDGVVRRGTCIVVPVNLHQRAVELAHEGHQGKGSVREKVWFSGIDVMVGNLVGRCVPCQVNYNPQKRKPLQMTELRKSPWSKLSTDFYGP